ncbi:uncharacterized protein M6B38_207140 [Iris pallida]|uniref:Uncharacterized protein n=1 Tax=Iris pallida TaxID=29817 RepID=A0AAX6E6F8_IRIPA|nr:uncharacterized protein M6B38_207140 [Iris pallida]
MEKPRYRKRPVICATLILLGLISFSCCVAAESRRVKDKDMRADGNLCSLPRRPAFGLGVIALVCLSVAQIVGTTSAATTGLRGKTNPTRNQAVPVTLLLLSWISFALAAVLLGTASSMNNRQPYGRGWMDGKCYVVKNGVFVGAAVLAVMTVGLIIGFTFATRRTIADEERVDQLQDKQPPSFPRPTQGYHVSDANNL